MVVQDEEHRNLDLMVSAGTSLAGVGRSLSYKFNDLMGECIFC
jgi:hypothetical protein